MSILNAATGAWGYQTNDDLAIRLRATYQLVWHLRRNIGKDIGLEHVRGHTGQFGNEMADTIANAIRKRQILPWKPKVNLAHWFHGSNPSIQWAWLPLEIDRRPGKLPDFIDNAICGTGLQPADPQLQWLRIPNHPTGDSDEAWLHIRIASYNVSSLREAGRAALLREQAEYYELHALGLQETRSSIVDPCDSNYVRIIAGAESGTGGCELWLSRTKPYAWSSLTSYFFQRQYAQVVHAEAQILLTVYQDGPLQLLFCVAHAPHSGQPRKTITTWWGKLTTLIHKYLQRNHLILMIDANADPQHPAEGIGELTAIARDKPRVGDECLSHFILQFGLLLPSTFGQWQEDREVITWTSNDGRFQARNDFIAIPITWQGLQLWSGPCEGLDSGTAGLDHTAVTLEVQGCFQLRPSEHRGIQFDRQRLLQASESEIEQCLDGMPTIPWAVDVTTHAAHIEQFVEKQLSATFPMPSTKRTRSKIFTEETWTCISTKNRSKKVLACDHRAMSSLHQWTALRAWRRSNIYSEQRLHILVYAIKISSTWKLHQHAAQQLRVSIRQDRGLYVRNMLQEISTADKTTIMGKLKPLKLGKRTANLGRKALPMVLMSDGRPAANPEEAKARWREHFASMEGGSETSLQALLRRQPACDEPEALSLADIPSLCELEAAMRHSKPGKALGMDRFPPEILHKFPGVVARLTWALFLKQSIFRCESLQHKGGRLVAAFKRRGDARLCSNYRSLLVSSSLGKCFHTAYRRRLMPHLHRTATSLQFTAQRAPHVIQAAHMVKAFLDHHCHNNRSAYAVFVDIKEAFYRVLRQQAIHSDCSDENIMAFLRRMQIDNVHIQDVATLIEHGPAIDDLGLRPHLSQMISELHRDTWFIMQNDECPVLTCRGTRPGDSFADVLWSLAFGRLLDRLEGDLYDMNILRDYTWNQQAGVHAAAGQHTVRQGIVAWADDVTILADAEDAEQLHGKLVATTETMIRSLLSYGMTPNMGPGKTEAIVTPKGRNALKVRRLLFNEYKCSLSLNTDLQEPVALRLVPKYRHLGSFLSHGANQRNELLHRLAQGQQSIRDYHTKIYRNPSLDLPQRVIVMRTTGMTATMYNMSSMGPLNQKDQKLWNHGIMMMYRKLMYRIYKFEIVKHITDDQVLIQVEQLHPEEELRIARLRAYGQYLLRDHAFHWVMLGLEQRWLGMVKADFAWLYRHIAGFTTHPHPHHDWNHWNDYIRDNPRKWKGLLRRTATNAILQRKLRGEVRQAHETFLHLLQQHGAPIQLTAEVHTTEAYHCTLCGKNYDSYRGWAVHAFKIHGRVHHCRQLQTGRVCAACGHQDWPDISRHHQSVRQQWLRSNGGLQWNQPLEVKPSRTSKVVQPSIRGKLLVRTHYHNDMDGL